jgi:hypothetical protein
MSEKSTSVKPAKMCYSHIGGKLGQLLVENFAEEFKKLGLDLSKIKSENL